MATTKSKGGPPLKAGLRTREPKGDGKRSQKIAEAVRGELMNMLLAGEVHDPTVNNVLVSAVELTDDLRIARVYVRLLDIEAPQAARDALIKGLYRAKGFLRRELAQRVQLRYAPDLRFHWDESIDRGREMEMLLREIKSSDGEPKP